MNFIRNRNFRAGPQTSLEGFICPQNSDKKQKIKVFGRSGGGYNPLCRNVRGAIVADHYANITIGNHVHVSSPCIWARNRIVIGNDVKIGGDTIIIDSDAHSINFLDRRIFRDNDDRHNANSKEVVVGNDVLIGTKCIILKGVHIGARSVIGAGSVVVSDIPQDSIAAGNPCKVIRKINE